MNKQTEVQKSYATNQEKKINSKSANEWKQKECNWAVFSFNPILISAFLSIIVVYLNFF